MVSQQSISGKFWHTLVIDENEHVWAVGSNSGGKLGLGDNADRSSFTQIPRLENIRKVATGQAHSLFLDSQGFVYGAGRNTFIQIGFQDWRNRDRPERIPNLTNIVDIATGQAHSLALTNEGKVYTFGWNEYGQRGSSTYGTLNLVTDVPKIIAVSAGEDHSLILDENHQVWAFGQNQWGQLGVGDKIKRTNPTLITGLPPIKAISAGINHSIVLSQNGEVYGFGWNVANQFRSSPMEFEMLVPFLIPGLSSVTKISAGGDYTLALNHKGVNLLGRLTSELQDRIIPLTSVVQISAGLDYGFAMTNDGTIYGFGGPTRALGLDSSRSYPNPEPIPIIGYHPAEVRVASLFIITIYPLIDMLGDYVNEFRINSTVGQDTIMEFELTNDETYLARVQYDPSTDAIDRPLEDDEGTYFELLETLIKDGKLQIFDLRPDFYQDDKGNQGFEFEDTNNQRYLIRIYEDEYGGIHPPK